MRGEHSVGFFLFLFVVLVFSFNIAILELSCSQQWWDVWLTPCAAVRAKKFFPSLDASGRADTEQLPTSASRCCHCALALQPGARLFKTKLFAQVILDHLFFLSFFPLVSSRVWGWWGCAHSANPCSLCPCIRFLPRRRLSQQHFGSLKVS